jgi:hypothetical protein
MPVVLLGAAWRVVGLTASPLWYDESVSLYMTRLPLLAMVRAASLDFSPPLWEIIAWPFVRAFGNMGLRLPSLVSSLASLWLAHKITRSLGFSIAERFCGLTLVALLPYQFYLAQDGRTYAVMSALYLGAIVFALRRRWLGLAACCGLLLWSHSTGVFYVANAIGLAIARWPQLWRRALASGALAAASFSPWLPALVSAGQRHHWLGELTSGLFNTGLVRIFFADALPGPAWMFPAVLGIAASIITAAVVSICQIRCPQYARLGLAAAGPLVLMVAAAAVKNVLFYRPMSAMSIPLALWIGMTLPRAWRPLRFVLGYNWLMLLAAGLLTWSPASKGAEMRALAERMNEPGAVVYHATATSLLPFSLLLPDQEHVLLDDHQHSGLLSDDLRDVFGLRRAPFEQSGAQYIVWARDALLSNEANARMAAYVRGATLLGVVHYWQAAPIEVYLSP